MTSDNDNITETLLRNAEESLRSFALRALAVSPALKVPYTDDPSQSPWSRTIGPEARRAHDLSSKIRKHLRLSGRPLRAIMPPLDGATALRDAVADLYMAGIKTGEQYERLASEVITSIVKDPR